MFARTLSERARRRGVVLILILGMLGLLALIGVTFATFSNQSQVNARNFSQAASFPDPNEMFDFALAQLINDTSNPASVIRGHSLKRDMYGSDAVNNGALLNGMPDGSSMTVTGAVLQTSGANAGTILLTTNIPSTSVSNAFYGYDFTRWVLTFPTAQDTTNAATYVSRTHEILVDSAAGDGNNRTFLIAAPNYDFLQATGNIPTTLKNVPPFDSPVSTPVALAPMIAGYISPETSGSTVWKSTLTTLPPVLPSSASLPAYTQVFTLDGRFLHAFNGPGLAGMNAIGNDLALLGNSSPPTTPNPHPLSEYANFRYNGNIFVNLATAATSPTSTGSFTPGYGDPNYIPVAMDEDYDACDLENWFLAIQSADGKVVVPSFHRPGIVTAMDWTRTLAGTGGDVGLQLMATRAMSRILRPRQADGHSSISFPDLTPNPTTGTIQYDVDNDGDGTTDSVWLDLGYPPKRSPEGQLFKPLFAFMVIGLNGRLPLNTAGNLQARDNSLQPTFDHAEHLGVSPSEIDLKFALQNAWQTFDASIPGAVAPYQQVDNAGVSAAYDASVGVSLTQLRNILTGTRPWVSDGSNGDQNTVLVNGNFVHLPNNVADVMDNPTPSAAGQSVLRTNSAVAGRWGEVNYVPGPMSNPLLTGPAPATTPPNFSLLFNNAIRAGYSAVPPGGTAYDARDDNFNTFDFNGESNLRDYYDATGSLALPVERIRRFVTPIDLDGNGRVITFNTYKLGGGGGVTDNGADNWGRVSFFRYFRPPGVPSGTFGPGAPSRANYPAPVDMTTPYVNWYDSTTTTLPTPPPPYHYDVRTNNIFHGFMSALTPDFTGAGAPSALAYAAMPSDVYPSTAPIGSITEVQDASMNPVKAPTYTIAVNSNPAYISPGLNEADEMNLYTPNSLDSPFGAGDLEWLYRMQDVDGASLTSRLQYLAPISFLNPLDGSRRRRLFCLDTWEPTNFVWANDNPGGVFSPNTLTNTNGNSRFNAYNLATAAASGASFPNIYNMPRVINPDPAADYSPLSNSSSGAPYAVQTPSLAHRDRRINLNFPLPVSNSPYEPLRQKWVRETYQLLKAVLPPRAVDTPEELAALSQYVVNIVDFRDPDCTMTKFVNTDILVTEPATSNGAQATLAFASGVAESTVAYDVTYTPTPGATAPHFLVQHGMEYQPVAINEVLAYMFQAKNQAAPTNMGDNRNDTPRLAFELVNMLTKDGITESAAYPNDSSNLDLTGFDFTVLPDDSQGRPDPITGQVPLIQTGLWMPATNPFSDKRPFLTIPASGGSVNDYKTGGTLPLTTPAAISPPLAALTPRAGANGATNGPDQPSQDKPTPPGPAQVYYYIFGNAPPALATAETQTPAKSLNPSTLNLTAATTPPAPAGYVDLTGLLCQRYSPAPASPPDVPLVNPPSANSAVIAPGYYYWLYLRRPSNPFDPNSEMVVVDSFRFMFTKSQGVGYTGSSGDQVLDSPGSSKDFKPNSDYIFSLQRMQPYRGGHAVPPITPAPLASTTLAMPAASPPPYNTFMTAYGYSEQTAPCLAANSSTYVQGMYGTVPSTGKIYHTLGNINSPQDNARDYFPFNDRDFMSVVELMLVPSCAPGLFTKQFAELPPPLQSTYQNIQALPYMVPQPYTDSAGTNPPPTTPPASTVPPAVPNPPLTTTVAAWTNSPWPQTGSGPIPLAGNGAPHSFPYLNDEFFYTGASEPTPPTAAGVNGWVGNEPIPSATTYVPFRSPSNGHYIGGPGGSGFHKMLDFFEVPSSAMKAIGEVANGTNYDWARQDLRPGMINLNLVVDEEVFLGLMGNSIYRRLAQGQIGMPGSPGYSAATTPSLVTQVNDNGLVTASYHIPNVGYWDPTGFTDPLNNAVYPYSVANNTSNALMKACFADFLSVRHGGTGFLYGYGTGAVGQLTPLASERPFHTLSYPDINYTVLRPAALPPSANTNPAANPATIAYPLANAPQPVPFVWDPGVKNPYLYVQNAPTQPPPIPPRRLFQISDAYGSPDGTTVANPSATPPDMPSNASVTGDPNVNKQAQLNYVAASPSQALTILNTGSGVTNAYVDLTSPPYKDPTKGFNLSVYLGGNGYDASQPNSTTKNNTWQGGWPLQVVKPPAAKTIPPDQRDHPYFRTEWLQKVTNLTTVRTHQYAVWITVGFFEVTAAGDPTLANTNPFLAYDTLGNELGYLDGKNIRYRGFFLIDRTQAVGFNPFQPDDFRACVAYRQLIE